MVATKKETKKTGDSAVKKRKQQEDSSSAVAARTTDEFNFPRGGASVLTPLEHKEISRKADEDVLFSVIQPRLFKFWYFMNCSKLCFKI
jgi:rRNA biogenesis protein RRP5